MRSGEVPPSGTMRLYPCWMMEFVELPEDRAVFGAGGAADRLDVNHLGLELLDRVASALGQESRAWVVVHFPLSG